MKVFFIGFIDNLLFNLKYFFFQFRKREKMPEFVQKDINYDHFGQYSMIQIGIVIHGLV